KDFLSLVAEHSDLWNTSKLWKHVSFDESSIQLDDSVSAEGQPLFITAVLQKLQSVGLTIEDAQQMQSYFQNGGWPLRPLNNGKAVHMALRLTEPETFADSWVLETVLYNPGSSSYWTP